MPKLTSLAVRRQNQPGKYRDTDGLILQVTRNKSGTVRKSWLVRYSCLGKQREVGLGCFPELSLADARMEAADIRLQARRGVDRITEKRAKTIEQHSKEVPAQTFENCAERFLASHESGWSNSKHRQQWRNSLRTYAYPILGPMNVVDVTLTEILQVLEPIWYTKTETAKRVRSRIEKVLAWSIVRGFRPPPNPAVWRGHLELLLPKPTKIAPVKHFAAMDWQDVPAFVGDLHRRPGPSARALTFTILTAARSGEVRNATWAEIDWDSATWLISAERMKMRNAHRVPLSAEARAVLHERRKMAFSGRGDYIFYRKSPQTSFSDSVYRALYKRMGILGITTHGFRSSFRDWVGEATNYPRELAEHSLAHRVGDATERAYRRGDALEKRRALMADWGRFCFGVAPTTTDEGGAK